MAPLPWKVYQLPQEFNDYLSVRTESSIIVDRSVDGDLLRINFNLRCFFRFDLTSEMLITLAVRFRQELLVIRLCSFFLKGECAKNIM